MRAAIDEIERQLGVPAEAPLHLSWAYGAFLRSIGLFDAILLLLDNKKVLEAMSLARGLMEDAFRMEQFALADERRQKGLFLGFQEVGLKIAEGWFRAAHEAGLELDLAAPQAETARRRAELREYSERHGVKGLAFATEKNHATSNSRLSEWVNFKLFEQMVHGSEMAHMFARDVLDGAYNFRPSADPKLQAATVLACCDMMLLTLLSFVDCVDALQLPVGVHDLQQRVKAIPAK